MWQKIYDSLIARAKNENRSDKAKTYYEKHHIIPKHAGGSNEDGNLVLLTFREHILAHYILWKIHKRPGDRLMYLLRSQQKEEAQKLRVEMAVKSNRNGGLGFSNWSGEKHPLKDPDKIKQVIKTKRMRYGKSLRKIDNDARKKLSQIAKERANRPEVKLKRANTIKAINATLSKEQKLKKYPRQKERNANWGRIKGYYEVVKPNGEVIKFSSQSEIIDKLGVTQSFLIRNRNKGFILKPVTYLPNGSLNSGKWNGWNFIYHKNPHPKTGTIEKQHKSHKK